MKLQEPSILSSYQYGTEGPNAMTRTQGLLQLLRKFTAPDLVTFNTILSGMGKRGLGEEAMQLCDWLELLVVTTRNRYSCTHFCSVLCGCLCTDFLSSTSLPRPAYNSAIEALGVTTTAALVLGREPLIFLIDGMSWPTRGDQTWDPTAYPTRLSWVHSSEEAQESQWKRLFELVN
jgi:hypothetical protein